MLTYGKLLWTLLKEKDNTSPATNPEIYNDGLPARYTGVIVAQSCQNSQPLFDWIKALAKRWNPCLALLQWPKTWDWIGHGSRGNPSTVVRSKEHSEKMTCYRHSAAPTDQCLSHHQRSFILYPGCLLDKTFLGLLPLKPSQTPLPCSWITYEKF